MTAQSLHQQVQEYCERLTVADLREIARHRRFRMPTGPKQAVVGALVANLCDQAANRAILSDLTEHERQILDVLNWISPLDSPGIATLLKVWNIIRSDAEIERDLLHLNQLGLTFRYSYVRYFLSYALHGLVSPVLSAPIAPGTPPAVGETPAAPLLDALIVLLAFHVASSPMALALTKGWQLPDETLGDRILARTGFDLPKTLVASRPGTSPRLWELALALAHRLEFLMMGKPALVNMSTFLPFLSLPPASRLAICYRAWIELTSWSEWRLLQENASVRIALNRLARSQGTLTPEMLDRAFLPARRVLIRMLERLDPAQWYSHQATTAALYRLHPNVLELPTSDMPYWAFAKAKDGAVLTLRQHSDWEMAAGAFVEQWLRGPLTWFGALTWKGDFFRVTPLGAWLFGAPEKPPPWPASTDHLLDVGADGAIMVDLDYRDADVWKVLLSMTTLQADRTLQEDRRFCFQPQPGLMADWLDSGGGISPIQQMLQQTLPANAAAERLRQTLAQWASTYGRIRIYEDAACLELADEYALPEIEKALPPTPLRTLTPALAAFDRSNFVLVREFLVNQGHTPTVVDKTPGDAPAAPHGVNTRQAP